MDQDRLFAESRFGQRVAELVESRSVSLSAENRQLERELEQEERALTELRATLDPVEFRQRADEFNAKVQRIRAEQDAKVRALSALRDNEQQRFLAALRPVLIELAADYGAAAIIDRRLLLLASDSIDITNQAIERVNSLSDEDSMDPALAPGSLDPRTVEPDMPESGGIESASPQAVDGIALPGEAGNTEDSLTPTPAPDASPSE